MSALRVLKQKWKGTMDFKNQYGWKKTFVVVKRVLLKQPIDDVVANSTPMPVVPVNKDSKVKDLLNVRFRGLQPIPSIHVNDDVKRLNLVTDSIDKNSLLGGVATALIVATEFARKNDMILRIITRTEPVTPANYKNIIAISGLEPYEKVEFYSDCDRDKKGDINHKLEVSKTDVFFATSWWSAEAIKKTTRRKRFYYIIQEVETFFYPHGEDHYLCSRIMEDENIDYIINSKYLRDYFEKNTPHIVENGVFFYPAFAKDMYKASDFKEKEKYKLFFYARPNNPRNMFYYGLSLLDHAIETGVLDTDKWEICFAGQNIPKIIFNNGYQAKDLGLMSWEKYGEFLSTVDLAVSLMYTPHPSYPPYDVACSGGVVLTNQCLNKLDFPECKNILMADLDKDEFVTKMKDAIKLATDMKQRKKNYEESAIPRDWVKTLGGVMDFMQEKL